jgi:hypothetical protein
MRFVEDEKFFVFEDDQEMFFVFGAEDQWWSISDTFAWLRLQKQISRRQIYIKRRPKEKYTWYFTSANLQQ